MMSTVHTTTNADSDSENDEDYAPGVEHDSESSDDEHQPKRARHQSPVAAPEDPDVKKRERDELWASFSASVSAPAKTSTMVEVKKVVKIEKRHRFAGQEVVEVVDVLEDSPDAKKWPLWVKPITEDTSPNTLVPPAATPRLLLPAAPPSTAPINTHTPSEQVASSSRQPTAPSKPEPSTSILPLKRPPPRKARTFTLPSTGSAAATAAPKPRKLSTLEKAAMDWSAHVCTSGQDAAADEELEANRRANANGAGYLGKMDFLNLGVTADLDRS